MDLRKEPMKPGKMKKFQAFLDTIPGKRMRPGTSTIAKPVAKPSAAKAAAIVKTIQSSSASNILTTTAAVRKQPVAKSTSGPSTSKAVATVTRPVGVKAPVKPEPAAKPKMKPAPYDFKARHALLLEKFNELKSRHEQQKQDMADFEDQKEAAEQRERDLNSKIQMIEQELFESNELNALYKEEIESLKATNSNLEMKNKALAQSLTATSEELRELKAKQIKLEQIAKDHEELLVRSGTLATSLDSTTEKLVKSQEQLYLLNIERMVLHNVVLDLRGNIRVFARVRPPLPAEEVKTLCGFSFNDEASLEIINNELGQTGARKQAKHDFSFDHVFDPNTLQEDIFEIVSPLIQSALDGYNVCIFAYGEFKFSFQMIID